MFEPIERNREDVLHAWSLAHTLHTQLPADGQVGGGADFREQVEIDPQLSTLQPNIKKGLFMVAEIAPAAGRTLLELARTEPFLADPELARRVVARLRGHPAVARAIAALAAGLRREEVVRFDPAMRRLAAEVIAAGVEHPVLCRAFDLLLKDPGFTESNPPQQRALLDYLLGPALSSEVAPMRRNRMRLVWASRVEQLVALIRSDAHRSVRPSLAREQLRDFLHAPVQEVVFLDATARNGHAAVVFGDPSDRRALSYGRRWVLSRDKRPVARTYAPDPSAHSGWTKPMSDSSIRYHGRSVMVSRSRERALITWIEKSFVFFDDLRARGELGERPVAGESAPFVERALAALEGMYGDRKMKVTTAVYLAGRKTVGRRRPTAQRCRA